MPIVASSLLYDCRYSHVETIAEDEPNDLILFKISGYESGSIKVFPKFFRSSEKELPKRTQLVRLGYPMDDKYSHIAVTWNEAIKSFNWDRENTRLTCFADQGFSTQYEVDVDKGIHFLETNSPALMGQSGGPILTAQGIVAGVQSKNSEFELEGNRTLTVSIAASHVAIARFLEKHAASVQINWFAR